MTIIQHGAQHQHTRVVDQFEADDLGAPFKVILHDSVKVTTNNKTGEIVSYSIPDLDGLLRAIVITRIVHPRKLSGPDIKFVRKVLSLKQKDTAKHIEMSAEYLSRCEAGTLAMSPSGEKLLRIFCLKTALKIHKLKACEMKNKLEKLLDRLFEGMKPMPVADIKMPLVLHLHRSSEADDCDLDSEGHWDGDLADAA